MTFFDKINKKWDSTTFDNIIVFIHKTFSKICKEYALLKTYCEAKSKEMFMSALIKIQLEEFFGVSVINEGMNGHGKVDIMIDFGNGIKHIIECKRYKGKNSILTIYKQIQRHTTSDDKTASLIMFCESKDFQTTITDFANWINANTKLIERPFKEYKNYKNIWKNEIRHDYGHVLTLHCACYHVYFDKQHAKFN